MRYLSLLKPGAYFAGLILQFFSVLILLATNTNIARAQILTLKSAVQTALDNYGSIKAKSNYVKASQASAKEAKSEYLPDFSIGAQQAFGTANGQFGPLYASRLSAASAGPVFYSQNWNAAFGALYAANINWDFFSFGKAIERNHVAQSEVQLQTSDLEQEKFQQAIKVAGAYLNLLAAQRLKISWQKNLDRANALRNVVVTRTKNGLNPGVDSSLANAEVSNAKIALTNAIDFEQEQDGQLAQLMNVPYREFTLDTVFVNRVPLAFYDSANNGQNQQHPVLRYYQDRVDLSRSREKYYDRFRFPVFSLFGVLQTRASGFGSTYSTQTPADYSGKYWDGIKPGTGNYVLGVGVSWNMTSLIRVHHQVSSQQYISKGLQNEFDLVSDQLKTQMAVSEQKIKNAISNYNEAPIQMKAASDAYMQRTVLYKNGLTNIVDVTQALYTLNRAETDRDIAVSNVWQALLLKAAATGNINLFMNEF